MVKEMPKVQSCSVKDCAYNTDESCHAMAITVGDPESDPMCDTYFHSEKHGGVKDMTAGVGACKAADCKYNDEFECSASQILVGYEGDQPDCLTFSAR